MAEVALHDELRTETLWLIQPENNHDKGMKSSLNLQYMTNEVLATLSCLPGCLILCKSNV